MVREEGEVSSASAATLDALCGEDGACGDRCSCELPGPGGGSEGVRPCCGHLAPALGAG